MSTIYCVSAHRAVGLTRPRRIDYGISRNRDYVIALADRCMSRLSNGPSDPETSLAKVVAAAGRSEVQGAPIVLNCDYGAVTILVLTEERREQLRHLAEGEDSLVAEKDIEALQLGAHIDDHELQNVLHVMGAAEERLSKIAELLPVDPEESDDSMTPSSVYIVHAPTGAAYWLNCGELMTCPLDRGGDLRLGERSAVEYTEPEQEPATHFVRQALMALNQPTPQANPDLLEVFASDQVDWIGAASFTEGATYIPIVFEGGQVGYAIDSPSKDRQEYLYLSPSTDDEGAEPAVFVYLGPAGSPDRDRPVHYFRILEEDQAPGPSRTPLPPSLLRQAAVRTICEGRVPDRNLTELVGEFGAADARTVTRGSGEALG